LLPRRSGGCFHGVFIRITSIDDVKAVAKAILRHRLVRNYRAEAEGYSMDRIIEELL
jgi:MoxR-like ATPase